MGTAATICASILNGAHMVRLSRCRRAQDIVLMSDAILNLKIKSSYAV